MRPADLKFLKDLTESPSPSGFEQPAAKVFREFVSRYADSVKTNVMGSVHAVLDAVPGKVRAGAIGDARGAHR